MNEPNTYSAKEIERYQRGEMTPAEMHLLEKAALDDPFLADALEGYQYTANPSADLGALQKRLQQRIEGKRRSGAVVILNSWMKIAAVLVLLAGGGWFILQTFSGNSRNFAEMMSRKNDIVQKNEAAQIPDSASPASTFAAPHPENSTEGKEGNSVASADVKRQAGNTRQKTAAIAAPTAAKKDTFTNDKYGYEANANTLAKAEASSDKIDSKFLPPTGQPTTSASDTVRRIDVALQADDRNLQEVIIARPQAKRLAGRASGVTIDTLEPAEGWSSFDNYVADNLEVPKEWKEKKPLDNEVELSFDVDKEGNPVNIAVTKSLCYKCDEEAIRLLKEGPKWKGKKKRGKVKIAFPLSP